MAAVFSTSTPAPDTIRMLRMFALVSAGQMAISTNRMVNHKADDEGDRAQPVALVHAVDPLFQRARPPALP